MLLPNSLCFRYLKDSHDNYFLSLLPLLSYLAPIWVHNIPRGYQTRTLTFWPQMPLLQDDSLQNTGTVVQERKKCPLLPCYLEIEEDIMNILGIQGNRLK